MLTPLEAEKLILEQLAPFSSEHCPLVQAHGRVLRIGVRADRDLPPFDRVTMDGFALRAAALAKGLRTFRVEGIQAAGMMAQKLGVAPEACIEVMTGAVLPTDSDCVVPYEDTARSEKNITVSEESASRLVAGHALHRRGSDHPAGTEVVPAGIRLTGREIAVAAACGCTSLTVTVQPKIAVVATGDELVDIDMPVAAHQIRRSNDYALRAGLIAAGFPRVERFHLRDMRHEIEHRLWHILAEYDVVLLSGGVSKGKFDYLPAVFETLSVKKIFHGVAQRPGKPLWFGLSARRTPIFALPGNPVSAYTCFHRYVLPALAQASGLPPIALPTAQLAAPVTFRPKLAYFLPVRISSGPRAERMATPDPSNTSGDFAGLVGTDGFVELPAAQDEFPAGYIAPFRSWV